MNSTGIERIVAVPRSPNLSRWLPALGWLRTYNKAWLRGDVVAGVTLAAYLLPAGLGDASLANLLKFDSILGRLDADVSSDDTSIKVGEQTIAAFAERVESRQRCRCRLRTKMWRLPGPT